MSDKISTGDFDYGSVDEDTASKLEYFAKTGKALIRKSQIQFIADFGKILSEAREVLSSHNKNEGTFVKWATAEFDLHKQTVYNYVNAWDRILSNGSTTYLNWSATALYLLSSDEIPTPVLKKLEKIPATDLVRACDVKRLIEASKPKPEPDDSDPFDDGTETTPVDAAAEKAKAKADAASAKAKAKADAAAERQRVKDEAAAAKEKAKADKEAAKAAALTDEGQITNIKSLINQHIGKLVRHLDDLNRLKPNRAALNASLKACEGIKTW